MGADAAAGRGQSLSLEIPTFTWANKAGLRPQSLDEIEMRGEPAASVRRTFARPFVLPWNSVRNVFATREI